MKKIFLVIVFPTINCSFSAFVWIFICSGFALFILGKAVGDKWSGIIKFIIAVAVLVTTYRHRFVFYWKRNKKNHSNLISLMKLAIFLVVFSEPDSQCFKSSHLIANGRIFVLINF